MAAAPWYLLAGGIVLVIVGYFIGGLSPRSGRVFITHKMSDEEVERQLNQARGSPPGRSDDAGRLPHYLDQYHLADCANLCVTRQAKEPPLRNA